MPAFVANLGETVLEAAAAGVSSIDKSKPQPSTMSAMTQTASVPVIDISQFVSTADESDSACGLIAQALHDYGCLVVKDPRVEASANEKFLDMMERYFDQSDGKTDARPDLHYQVGVTPSEVEKPRGHCAFGKTLKDVPVSECPPVPDAKWRFFWRVGERPAETAFEELNAPAVVPEAFEREWKPTMDGWGEKLVGTAETVAEMAAIGFGLDRAAFKDRMTCGPHLLAPTGSDLKHLADTDAASEGDGADAEASAPKKPRLLGQPVGLNTVLAGFHYDLNFLTIHGKSRFPGLKVWTRDGHAVAPKIPPGHLFLQAGKQFEYLTGGHVLAGFHEVIAHKQCAIAAREAKKNNKSTWRVSSTCFAHIASDVTLEPIGKFASDDLKAKYPPIKTGDQVQEELIAISLGAKKA